MTRMKPNQSCCCKLRLEVFNNIKTVVITKADKMSVFQKAASNNVASKNVVVVGSGMRYYLRVRVGYGFGLINLILFHTLIKDSLLI